MAKAGIIEIDLAANTARFQSDMRKATAALNSNVAQMRRSNESLKKSFEAVKNVVMGFAAVAAVKQMADYSGQVLKAADAFNQLTGRVKNSLDSVGQFDSVFKQLVESSNRTGSSIDAVAQGFVRLRPAAQELGVTNEQLIRFNETFAKMGALAGATGEEIKYTMIQLSQGLASGTLRGDELRSVLEQMPQVARVIADSMKIPFSSLKDAAKDGQITADKVIKAILDQSAAVDAQFQQLPASLDRSINRMQNSMTLFIGSMNDAVGATESVAQAVDGVSVKTDQLSQVVIDNSQAIKASTQAFSHLFNAGLELAEGLLRWQPFIMSTETNMISLAMATDDTGGIFRSVLTYTLDFAGGLDYLGTTAQINAEKIRAFFAGIPAAGNRDALASIDLESNRRIAAISSQFGQRRDARGRTLALSFGGVPSPIDSTLKKSVSSFSPYGSDSKKKKQGKSEAEKEMDRLKQQAKSLTESLRNIWEVEADEIAFANKLLKMHLIDQKTYNRAVDEAIQKREKAFKIEGLDDAIKQLTKPLDDWLDDFDTNLSSQAFNTAFSEVQRIVEETTTPLEKYNQQIEYLNYLHNNAGLSAQAFYRALDIAGKELQETDKHAQQFSQAMGNVISEFGDRFFDTFTNALKTGKFEFKSFVASMLEDIGKLIFKLTVTIPLVQALTGFIGGRSAPNPLVGQASQLAGIVGGSLGGPGGALVGALGSLSSSIFRANGGPVSAGSPYIVGERGPELFVPKNSGSIVRNGRFGAGGGGMTVVNNVTVSVDGSKSGDPQQNQDLAQRMAKSMRTELEGMMDARIAFQLRQGNLLNPGMSVT